MAEHKLNGELKRLLEEHDCPKCPAQANCLLSDLVLYSREHQVELNLAYAEHLEAIASFSFVHLKCLLEIMKAGRGRKEFREECADSVAIAFMSGYVVGLQSNPVLSLAQDERG
jgi:hypothetical protein